MIALPAGVLVALEALEHVVAVGIARFEGESGGAVGAPAAATQEEHERFLVDLMGQLRDKAGIRLAAGVGLPFDFDGVRNAPDPVQLGARAHIDEFGAGREFEDLERLGGRERPRIGQIHVAGATVRQREKIIQFSHGSGPARMRAHEYNAWPMSGENRDRSRPVEKSVDERARRIHTTTLVAAGTNFALALGQITIGLFANAQSLVADAFHTLSDLLADALVMFANRRGAQPADEDHPYGHARIETAASLALGLLLVVVGAGFLASSGLRLQQGGAAPVLHPLALWMALATLAAKEGLFRFMLNVGREMRSPMLEANAWHARSDAASSLVVALGIGGSLLGFSYLEPLAAAIVGFMIARMGVKLAYEAVRELIDTGLDERELETLRVSISTTPGVLGLHELRTRKMAHRVLVDAHVQVSPRITVSEGHRIAEAVRGRVRKAHHNVQDVLVHIDVETDMDGPRPGILPDREELMQVLADMLGGEVPQPMQVRLHYLGGKVEAELYLPFEWLQEDDRASRLQARISSAAEEYPAFRQVVLYAVVAH